MSSIESFISNFAIDITDVQSIDKAIIELQMRVNEAIKSNDVGNALKLQKLLDFSNSSRLKSLRYADLYSKLLILQKNKEIYIKQLNTLDDEIIKLENYGNEDLSILLMMR